MAPTNRGPRLELNKYGTWEIRWSEDRRSMRKTTGCAKDDRGAAELKLAEFLQSRAKRAPGALTVGAAVDDYLREHVDHGDVVDKVRQHDIARNLRPHFGTMLCRDVEPKDARLYGDKRRKGVIGKRPSKSTATIRRELNMLIAAMNHAVRARRLTAGDVPHIPLPAPAAPKDFWLNETEAAQLLAACDAEACRGSLFIRIALATAARRHSIETLTWSQVDLTARRIQFNPIGRRQTAKRRVALPISDALLPHLQRAYAAREGELVLGSDSSITKRLEAVCRRAFADTGNSRFLLVTPHTLRHTWATLAARAGVSLFEIAGVLGDTLATVQKNYLHHSPDHLRGAVNFMASGPVDASPQRYWRNHASENGTVANAPHPEASDRGAPSGAQPEDLRATAPDGDQQVKPKPQVRAW